MLRHYVDSNGLDWRKFLALIEFAYNNSMNLTTKFTPFQLCHGYGPNTIQDLNLEYVTGSEMSKYLY